jgi:CcmD family protein
VKIGRSVRVLLLGLSLGALSLAPAVRGEEPVETRPAAPRSEQRPANIPFLFSAYALTWAAIWIYILLIHGRQRRVERMLDRLEKSDEAAGGGRG